MIDIGDVVELDDGRLGKVSWQNQRKVIVDSGGQEVSRKGHDQRAIDKERIVAVYRKLED